MSDDQGDAGTDTDDLDLGFEPTDPSDLVGNVDFSELSATDFEDFSFDLMRAVGFENVDWRKGTPSPSSPSDQGRDIVAVHNRSDIDGFSVSEPWFVDCKHYKASAVPPDALRSSVAWAEAERPDVLLFVVSGYLSNGAKNWITRYVESNNPRFRIRYWELPQLREMLANHQDIAFTHNVALSTLRRVADILKKEDELTQRLWYGRKPSIDDPRWNGTDPDVLEAVGRGLREVEAQFGHELLDADVASDFSWGELTGAVEALRWVLGDDWGNADS